MKMLQIEVSDQFLTDCPALSAYLGSARHKADVQNAWKEIEREHEGWERKDSGAFVMFFQSETKALRFFYNPSRRLAEAEWRINEDLEPGLAKLSFPPA